LFKYLAKQLVDDIIPTYELFIPLFSDHKSFIRHFAAEAFSFLLRKVKGPQLSEAIDAIVQSFMSGRVSLSKMKCYEEGVAMLFYETVKQVDGRLHSRGHLLLKEIFMKAFSESSSAEYNEHGA
jgi:U3 small nucleolar RNA-associated protein 20